MLLLLAWCNLKNLFLYASHWLNTFYKRLQKFFNVLEKGVMDSHMVLRYFPERDFTNKIYFYHVSLTKMILLKSAKKKAINFLRMDCGTLRTFGTFVSMISPTEPIFVSPALIEFILKKSAQKCNQKFLVEGLMDL